MNIHLIGTMSIIIEDIIIEHIVPFIGDSKTYQNILLTNNALAQKIKKYSMKYITFRGPTPELLDGIPSDKKKVVSLMLGNERHGKYDLANFVNVRNLHIKGNSFATNTPNLDILVIEGPYFRPMNSDLYHFFNNRNNLWDLTFDTGSCVILEDKHPVVKVNTKLDFFIDYANNKDVTFKYKPMYYLGPLSAGDINVTVISNSVSIMTKEHDLGMGRIKKTIKECPRVGQYLLEYELLDPITTAFLKAGTMPSPDFIHASFTTK